jgi:hypothetical protein
MKFGKNNMIKFLSILFAFHFSVLSANEIQNYVLYEAIAKSHEVLPTVIYPPSGGEEIPEKSLLGTFSLGKELHRFQLEKGFLEKLHTRIVGENPPVEPFYAKGENYIVETSDNKFYLIYYENDEKLDKDLIGIRFMLSSLLRIGEKENVFVKGAEGGKSCYDKEILKILKSVK